MTAVESIECVHLFSLSDLVTAGIATNGEVLVSFYIVNKDIVIYLYVIDLYSENLF